MAVANLVDVEGKHDKGKKRKANYSDEENLFIAEKFDELKDVLESKAQRRQHQSQEVRCWEVILTQHRCRFSTTNRTLGDLKHRLSYLNPRTMLSKVKSPVTKLVEEKQHLSQLQPNRKSLIFVRILQRFKD